jgi:hypothetical protein
MSDLASDCFTLCQADAARQDYTQLMEELDLVKGNWAASRRGRIWREPRC